MSLAPAKSAPVAAVVAAVVVDTAVVAAAAAVVVDTVAATEIGTKRQPSQPMPHPLIIQGGMGVAISGWPLARAVSRLGQLGVVSGTALAVVLARRLQLGDADGELRQALAQFPFRGMAERVL